MRRQLTASEEEVKQVTAAREAERQASVAAAEAARAMSKVLDAVAVLEAAEKEVTAAAHAIEAMQSAVAETTDRAEHARRAAAKVDDVAMLMMREKKATREVRVVIYPRAEASAVRDAPWQVAARHISKRLVTLEVLEDPREARAEARGLPDVHVIERLWVNLGWSWAHSILFCDLCRHQRETKREGEGTYAHVCLTSCPEPRGHRGGGGVAAGTRECAGDRRGRRDVCDERADGRV